MAEARREKQDGGQTIGSRIREARRAMSLSQAALGKLVGVDQSTVALWETDKTVPREDTITQLASILYLTPEFLRYGSSAETSPAHARMVVPVIGYVVAGNEVRPLKNVEQETAAPPVGTGDDGPSPTAALVVKGNSMWPVYRDGDILFFAESTKSKPAEMIGMECVVKIADGPMLVKRLMSGNRKGLYTLASYNAPETRDIAVEWCAPIVWVRRNLTPPND